MNFTEIEFTFFNEIQMISNEVNKNITSRCQRELPIILDKIKRHITKKAKDGVRYCEIEIDEIASLELKEKRLHLLVKMIQNDFSAFRPTFSGASVSFTW